MNLVPKPSNISRGKWNLWTEGSFTERETTVHPPWRLVMVMAYVYRPISMYTYIRGSWLSPCQDSQPSYSYIKCTLHTYRITDGISRWLRWMSVSMTMWCYDVRLMRDWQTLPQSLHLKVIDLVVDSQGSSSILLLCRTLLILFHSRRVITTQKCLHSLFSSCLGSV